MINYYFGTYLSFHETLFFSFIHRSRSMFLFFYFTHATISSVFAKLSKLLVRSASASSNCCDAGKRNARRRDHGKIIHLSVIRITLIHYLIGVFSRLLLFDSISDHFHFVYYHRSAMIDFIMTKSNRDEPYVCKHYS